MWNWMNLLSKIGSVVFCASAFMLLGDRTVNDPEANSYSPAVAELRQKYVDKYYASFFISTSLLGVGTFVAGEVLDGRRQKKASQTEAV